MMKIIFNFLAVYLCYTMWRGACAMSFNDRSSYQKKKRRKDVVAWDEKDNLSVYIDGWFDDVE